MPTLIVRLPADCQAPVLRDKLDDTGNANTVRELTLNNCILADTDELWRCISRCRNLRVLTCLSVPFKPIVLVRLLLGPLQQLTRLEFSLLVKDDDVADELATVEAIKTGLKHASAPNLHHMYVEVASEKNFALLSALLSVCPKVGHLHVHVLRGPLDPAIMKCSDILHRHELITVFMISSEVPSGSECEPPPALDMDSCAKVCSNVMQIRPPSSWNCLRLSDLVVAQQDQEGVHKHDTVTVVAAHRTGTPAQLTAAGERNRWDHVHHLCVVLFPAQNSLQYPTAEPVYLEPLRSFFGHFSGLVELNINSFHCNNLDMTQALNTTRLEGTRALSIAPCGIRHVGAVERLAAICPKLEDLDIRLRRAGRYSQCHQCDADFLLIPEEMTHLQEQSKLMRITLADVPNVASYLFLSNIQVAEVRLINSPSRSNQAYVGLGALLAVNEKLRCLVLVDAELPFGSRWWIAHLQAANLLRYLVMITEVKVREVDAVMYCHEVAVELARLEAMHVHFMVSNLGERRLTWIRSPQGPEELQGGPEPPGQPRGLLLHNRPCVMCSTETFIGLVKPHNRGTRTCF